MRSALKAASLKAPCPSCRGTLSIYLRQVKLNEPVVCPHCGGRFEVKDFDLKDEVKRVLGELSKTAGK